MSCEHGNHVEDCDLCDAVDAAYKAGQASVEQRVKELEELVDRQQGFLSYWKAKCAEFERDLKMTDEFRIKALNDLAALKSQAGKPVCWIYELSGYRSIAWGSSKPDFPAAKNPVPLYTHPTTERPYNPLNDYAVIPMSPTEPVKAQAGEPVAWMNKRGDVISAEEKTLIIENGKLGYPGGEFDLHAKNIERSYTIPLGVINV